MRLGKARINPATAVACNRPGKSSQPAHDAAPRSRQHRAPHVPGLWKESIGHSGRAALPTPGQERLHGWKLQWQFRLGVFQLGWNPQWPQNLSRVRKAGCQVFLLAAHLFVSSLGENRNFWQTAPMDLNVTSTLQKFLEAHSVPTQISGQALIAGSMSASAWVIKKQSTNFKNLLQLDINITSPLLGTGDSTESFAGWGDDEQGAMNAALDKFCSSSLHVLLSIFTSNKKDDDQVEWAAWGRNENSWQVCLGPLLISSFADQTPYLECTSLLDQLLDALLPKITTECHWLRFYYMRQGEVRVGSECLLITIHGPKAKTL